ncbi:MAG: ABC transporter ATP-binding protein [Filimonas sp.]|nr:ABC transporter ATP-binding protein [Filimonas sp.]
MIEFNHVGFGYTQKKNLYKDLQMNLQAGSIYGLLGRNGAGKSTLLKLITGLVFAKRGKVSVLGDNPAKRHPSFLQKIFFIPEEIDTPDIDVLSFAEDFKPFYPNFDKQQFIGLLHEMEVPQTKLSQMSYGQKKKTWIALGISANTELLILDEPTNGLDIPSKRQFRKMIASTINDNRCIIISTHQVRDLDSLIDRILVVENGELLVNSSIDTITSKLHFKQLKDDYPSDNVLYSESNLLGTSAVLLNNGGESAFSRIDIELFFNAVMANKQQMQSLFTA